MTDKQIYQIGLTMINGVGDILARHLLEALGDAEAVFTEKRQSLEKIPGIGDSIITEIKRADVLLRAEKELAFAQKNGISIIRNVCGNARTLRFYFISRGTRI